VNLRQAAIVVRQRTLLEVLDLACRFLFDRDPKLYAAMSAIVLLPCLALCVAARELAGWGWGWVWLLAVGLGTVAQGAFTVVAGRLMFTETLRPRAILGHYFGRLGTYLSALVTTRTTIALGFSVLLLGPVAWIRAAFVHEAVLLEGAGSGVEAFRRSALFTRHHARTTFELLLALSVITLGCVGIGESLGHGIVDFALQLGTPFGSLLDDGGSAYALAGYFASVPYFATARFLAYIDARTRGDGWDIQVRFLAIQAEDEGRVAA
jgi:hypothetical protein